MTLTEAAFWTKRFGVIVLAVIAIFSIIVIILASTSSQKMLPQYLTANFACTDTKEEFLPSKLSISSLQLASGSGMYFELQTDSGKVDALPGIINVYKFDNPTQTLSSQADAKILAKQLGFDQDAIVRNGTESYSWSDSNRQLTVLAKNLNFKLTTNASYIRSAASSGSMPSEQEAKSTASNFLRNLGVLSDDYSEGTPTTTLIKVNPDGSFSQAGSLSEAQLIKVDFNRVKSMITIPSNVVGATAMVNSFKNKLGEPTTTKENISGESINVYTFNTPITFLNPNNSNITVYVGVSTSKTNSALSSIYQIDYTYWPVEESACGTYQLISPETALQKVQSGQGSLIYLNDVNGDDVASYSPRKVKKFTILYVNLTYYESSSEQTFLQPVYVISGEAIFDNDTKGTFDFYYPAIDYDNVQNKIEQKAAETTDTGNIFQSL